MTFLTYMKETLDAGDPTIRSWALVNSYWAPFIISGLYVFFVKRLGPDLMRDRKPFDLRLLMITYNFSIVFAYAACLFTLLYYFLTTDAYKLICSSCVVAEGHYSYKCTSAGWYIYILKYVEFTDTVFFVLRKKNHLITNLHIIHHAAVPVIAWVMMRSETSGFQFIPGGINSFVHIIMYMYYGLAAMGPEVQKKLWWKEYLTLMQMLQFVIILLLMFVIIPLSGCKTSAHGIYIDIFFATLFLLLFYNYYTKTYNKKIDGALHSKANGVNGVNGIHKQNSVYKQNKVHKQNGVCMKES